MEMTISFRRFLLGGTVAFLAVGAMAASEGLAQAQQTSSSPPPAAAGSPMYDPAQLPAIKGTVARYSLTPRGDVDGLILSDGTEVKLPPHLSTQVVYTVKPGDAVTVRGLKALNLPLVSGVSITNDASGQTVTDTGAPPKGKKDRGGPGAVADELSVQGRVQMVLHGPRGEPNGALLDDGTTVRLPPPEAERLTGSGSLAAGQPIAARGPGLRSALGTVIDAREIGASPDQLSEIGPPPRGPKGEPGRRPPPPPR